MLGDTGLPLDRPPGKVVARPCCRSAYLRGAFLGGGSLSGPASPHLEIRTPLHGGAAFVRSVASATGVRLRVADRGSHSIAYAKSWEAIEAYLAVAGASDTVLALEERALVAELRAEANRLANADHANLVRQSRSARMQLEAVRRLEEEASSTGSPRRSRRPPSSAVDIRRSLFAIASLADPPVTKAAMAARLGRLVALAEEQAAERTRAG